MNDKELELIKKYVKLNGSTISEVMGKAILEKNKTNSIFFCMQKDLKHIFHSSLLQ